MCLGRQIPTSRLLVWVLDYFLRARILTSHQINLYLAWVIVLSLPAFKISGNFGDIWIEMKPLQLMLKF